MNTIQKKRTIWKKLAKSKAYRDAFVAVRFKRWLPFQMRVMRERRGWSQAELAEQAGLKQGAISRAENPDYGNLTVNTILKIAAGFDCAFEGRFVPFSRLATSFADQSEGSADVPSFQSEVEMQGQQATTEASTFPPSVVFHAASIPDTYVIQVQVQQGMFPVPSVANSTSAYQVSAQ